MSTPVHQFELAIKARENYVCVN